MKDTCKSLVVIFRTAILYCLLSFPAHAEPLPTDDGFHGIWYANQKTDDEYRYKYSGGMATYPQQHAPIAIYCPQVEKTFFVYGGTMAREPDDKQELLHMVSYFDHKTKRLARPRILLNKHTADAHDNPVLSVDADGYLWVFSPSHGVERPSFVHRSARPFDITEFEKIEETNFSYPQPWYVPGKGFLFLHTRYGGRDLSVHAARTLAFMTSPDGRTWSEAKALAGIDQGDYQISWPVGDRVATAFDFHPKPLGLNGRANLYYLETDDLGITWKTANGRKIDVPLTKPDNPALVVDSVSEGKLLYLKDLNFDGKGRPVILFLTSRGFEPGPKNGPREWQIARWTGVSWLIHPVTTSDNNYDHGSLYIEPSGQWRIIAPTEPGPQLGNPGGEMVGWISRDLGATWTKDCQLTRESKLNHTYARRPLNAHPDFWAIWADGDAFRESESRIYFANRKGEVFRLPTLMQDSTALPERVR